MRQPRALFISLFVFQLLYVFLWDFHLIIIWKDKYVQFWKICERLAAFSWNDTFFSRIFSFLIDDAQYQLKDEGKKIG